MLNNQPCSCSKHAAKLNIQLQPWMLECWQRKQYRRPYDTLSLHGRVFQEKLHRSPTNIDLQVIIDFLDKHSNTLKHFEVSYIKIPPAMAEELTMSLRFLTSISLVCTDMPESVLHVMALFADKFAVQNLRLADNSFTPDHAEHLHSFLLKNRTIQYLDLRNCGFNVKLFALIADGVWKSKTLQAINISKVTPINAQSQVESAKAASIVSILIHQCHLVEVHFKFCCLTCHDMLPIAEYLGLTSTALRYLDLGANKIGPDGCRFLFEAIVKAKKLIGLDLSNNIIKLGGDIIGHLLPCTHLKFLDISNNGIPADAMELILKTLSKPYQMQVLNIFGNQFNEACARTVRRKVDAGVLDGNAIDVCVEYDETAATFVMQHKANEKLTLQEQRVSYFYPCTRRLNV